MFSKRTLLVFLLDLLAIILAYVLAFLLRFESHLDLELVRLHDTLPIVVVVQALTFAFSRQYRSMWRYASLPDAIEIARTVTIAAFGSMLGLVLLNEFEHFSRSIFVLDWGILLSLIGSSRLFWRVYREKVLIPKLNKKSGPRTLIVGAGEAGNQLLREIRTSPIPCYEVVGLVDDDPTKLGLRLNGVPVLGDTRDLTRLAEAHAIEKVIIAIPSASGKAVRDIMRRCEMAQVRFKIVPGLAQIITGKVEVSQIKDVEIDDLLRREPVSLDDAAIRQYLTGKRVLVTGAGGSIGSELCRQIVRFTPAKLILFDHAETPLYQIELELAKRWQEIPIIPVIGDMTSRPILSWLFEEFRPDVVVHAAAYKHVPMMEYNPVEAVLNNVRGTMLLADMAHLHKVKNFVMVSTDKAVNPTNVMGATKRAAESYVQSLALQSVTKFTTVRFGNVLGSNGSVVPMFKEQIRTGGPVTVTDPEVTRYFMTIPEASQLVLQAGCLGVGGDIFVLDMGEPVLVLELAEHLIRLSGLVPYDDIAITFSGLRPGEKLYEELLMDGEGIRKTVHEKIMVLAPVHIDRRGLVNNLELLFTAAKRHDIGEMISALRLIVPEYTPAFHFHDDAPVSFQRMRPDLFPDQPAA